jgi:DUF971 family protein/molybdopterin converting factor small subunit
MTEHTATPTPTSINLHQKSRVLEICFSDGSHFNLPCEYLRVYSPASLEAGPVHGKAAVNLTGVQPQEQEALELEFDDGHCDSYPWPLLYTLGQDYEVNWTTYLQRLTDADLTRGDGRSIAPDAKLDITVFYFIDLATIAGEDKEYLRIPISVTNVQTLLAWLRKRGPAWEEAFKDDRVQVTVNKQFAELFTLIEEQDEVAIVPIARQK